MTTIEQAAPEIPPHVPPHLVQNYDLWAKIAEAGVDGYQRAAAIHHETPPIFYVPRLGYLPGAWVPRRAEDLRRILQDTDTFCNAAIPFAQMLGENWKLIPLEIDPPHHAKYRALVNTLFSPKKVDELAQSVREHATQLVDKFAARGYADFNEDFANWYPTLIFLRLMRWPTEEAETFVRWTHTMTKSMDMQEVAGAVVQVRDYLRERIAQGRKIPKDDFTGYLINSQVEGRPLTDDEIFGFCFLIFLGGLDTVASSLSLHFMHLARNPDQQADLRAHPEKIPQAVEELLRAYSIVNMRRVVTRDVQVGAAPMRAGDFVLISTELGNLDPDVFPSPEVVDFNRQDASLHMAFAYGPHRCVGSHLARRELVIAIETWLTRIPPFHMADKPIQLRTGGVFSVDGLRLEWDPTPGGAA